MLLVEAFECVVEVVEEPFVVLGVYVQVFGKIGDALPEMVPDAGDDRGVVDGAVLVEP